MKKYYLEKDLLLNRHLILKTPYSFLKTVLFGYMRLMYEINWLIAFSLLLLIQFLIIQRLLQRHRLHDNEWILFCRHYGRE